MLNISHNILVIVSKLPHSVTFLYHKIVNLVIASARSSDWLSAWWNEEHGGTGKRRHTEGERPLIPGADSIKQCFQALLEPYSALVSIVSNCGNRLSGLFQFLSCPLHRKDIHISCRDSIFPTDKKSPRFIIVVLGK